MSKGKRGRQRNSVRTESWREMTRQKNQKKEGLRGKIEERELERKSQRGGRRLKESSRQRIRKRGLVGE